MKKMIIVGMIAAAAFFFVVHLLSSSISTIKSEMDKENNKYKEKIGQKFILEKDTLTIINYSSIMETFTLSNGKEVNASIVFNKDSILSK